MDRPTNVLIVDDLAEGRETLESLLFSPEFRIDSARDGREALTKASANPPDVVLLDVMMPGMDGFEVCRRIRADTTLAEVPVLFISALEDSQSRLRGIEAGADDFISKPFNLPELRARVRTIVKLNRYRRLVAERTKFQWAVEHSEEGFVILNDRNEIAYANPQARFYMDMPANSTGTTFMRIAERRYRLEPADIWETWRRDLASPPSSPLFLVCPESPNAQAFWLRAESHVVSEGATRSVLMRLRDVSDEMNLRRAVWNFHSIITHKLNTPLSGLIGSLNVLIGDSSGLTDADRAEFVEAARESLARLNTVVRDIRAYLGAQVLASAGRTLGLDQVEAMTETVAASLLIEPPIVRVPEELKASALTLSPQAFERILCELFGNSKKFHPSGSPEVRVSFAGSGDGIVTVRVRDNGRTLSPEQLAKAWTPYYQAEKFFSGEIAGMGLGLPLVATLTWSVGGTCRILNNESDGVTVELDLPLLNEGN